MFLEIFILTHFYLFSSLFYYSYIQIFSCLHDLFMNRTWLWRINFPETLGHKPAISENCMKVKNDLHWIVSFFYLYHNIPHPDKSMVCALQVSWLMQSDFIMCFKFRYWNNFYFNHHHCLITKYHVEIHSDWMHFKCIVNIDGWFCLIKNSVYPNLSKIHQQIINVLHFLIFIVSVSDKSLILLFIHNKWYFLICTNDKC